MALSVSAAHLAPATVSLAPSDQKRLPQAMPDVATQALADAGPAAIYHPSEAAQTLSAPLEVVNTWVGRSDSPDLPRFVDRFNGAHGVLKSAFNAFQASLASTAPDLAGTDYGFTVQADGRLKVLDKAGQLSDANAQRLTDLLNRAPGLQAAAVAYRNAAIDMVDAGSPSSGSLMGLRSLTNENFASTIDLAPLLRPHDPSNLKGAQDRLFITQLVYKGERATEETERAMFERRGGEVINVTV